MSCGVACIWLVVHVLHWIAVNPNYSGTRWHIVLFFIHPFANGYTEWHESKGTGKVRESERERVRETERAKNASWVLVLVELISVTSFISKYLGIIIVWDRNHEDCNRPVEPNGTGQNLKFFFLRIEPARFCDVVLIIKLWITMVVCTDDNFGYSKVRPRHNCQSALGQVQPQHVQKSLVFPFNLFRLPDHAKLQKQ